MYLRTQHAELCSRLATPDFKASGHGTSFEVLGFREPGDAQLRERMWDVHGDNALKLPVRRRGTFSYTPDRSGEVDVVFILDAGAARSNSNYDAEKQLILDVAEVLFQEMSAARVAVVQSGIMPPSSAGNRTVQFQANFATFSIGLQGLSRTPNASFDFAALSFAADLLQGTSRPTAKRILVMLADTVAFRTLVPVNVPVGMSSYWGAIAHLRSLEVSLLVVLQGADGRTIDFMRNLARQVSPWGGLMTAPVEYSEDTRDNLIDRLKNFTAARVTSGRDAFHLRSIADPALLTEHTVSTVQVAELSPGEGDIVADFTYQHRSLPPPRGSLQVRELSFLARTYYGGAASANPVQGYAQAGFSNTLNLFQNDYFGFLEMGGPRLSGIREVISAELSFDAVLSGPQTYAAFAFVSGMPPPGQYRSLAGPPDAENILGIRVTSSGRYSMDVTEVIRVLLYLGSSVGIFVGSSLFGTGSVTVSDVALSVTFV